jgi:hypothetical protein
MNKNNYKKVEFQIKDVSASNFLCEENLLSYVKSNLSMDENYVLVVKYISLCQSIDLKSNKFLDYSFLSSDCDRILIGLYDSCYKTILKNIVSEKEFESHLDFFRDISNMKNKLVQEELLFSIIEHTVFKDDEDDFYYYDDYCYDDYCYDYDYDNLDIYYNNITMYFIPVDNYTDEVLDNIIKRFDV